MFLPVVCQVSRNSSRFSALLVILAMPVAASSIDFRVSPAFSNATVAAASALEGSGDTAPSMIGAAAGLVAVFRSPGPSPGRMSIATSPISDRESRGTDPAFSLYFRSSERVTSTPSG